MGSQWWTFAHCENYSIIWHLLGYFPSCSVVCSYICFYYMFIYVFQELTGSKEYWDFWGPGFLCLNNPWYGDCGIFQLLDLFIQWDWSTYLADYGQPNCKYLRVNPVTALTLLEKWVPSPVLCMGKWAVGQRVAYKAIFLFPVPWKTSLFLKLAQVLSAILTLALGSPVVILSSSKL